jgi:hypothetical protein
MDAVQPSHDLPRPAGVLRSKSELPGLPVGASVSQNWREEEITTKAQRAQKVSGEW